MKMQKLLAGVLASVVTLVSGFVPEIANEILPRLAIELTASAYDYNNPCTDMSGTCGDNLKWELSENGVLTISGTGDMYYCHSNYLDTIGSYFSYRTDIKQIIFEEGITGISGFSFYDCPNLESIIISNTVTYIGDAAFYLCENLENVTMGNSVETIGISSFLHCKKLKNISLPSSLNELGYLAFHDTEWYANAKKENQLVTLNSF